MKLPVAPTDLATLLERLLAHETSNETILRLLLHGLGPTPGGKYRHWDILRHLTPPSGLSHEEWWAGIKVARRPLYKPLPMVDRDGNPFKFAVVDPGLKMLHEIDQQASGAIGETEHVTDPGTRERDLIHSLFEEAITSSQLEGASTTRAVAKEMLKRDRAPRDRSEQMIYNNYQAMQFIRRVTKERLTPSIVCELHRTLTEGTLDDPSAAGRFRRPDEPITVYDDAGQVLHHPPSADQLKGRIDRLCTFANDASDQPFIHPVVRAIMLHFGLAYDHPFVDGNGRTARALFYWGMASRGYWLSEYLSISSVIKAAPSKYNRAFLYTETDENDATYFILNQLSVIVRAIRELHRYLQRKTASLRATRRLLQDLPGVEPAVNHRQLALIHHAIEHPGFLYTITSHRRSHGISYQTARTDLLMLVKLLLLDQSKRGRAFVFRAPSDLAERVGRTSTT